MDFRLLCGVQSANPCYAVVIHLGSPMIEIAFRFASAEHADRLVAGIPAAARLARAWRVADDGENPLVLLPSGTTNLGELTLSEIGRLALGLSLAAQAGSDVVILPGELLPSAETIAALRAGSLTLPAEVGDPDTLLKKAGRDAIRATAKPSDGIVSRTINRPVSQAISHVLLRFTWIRPGHATLLTALVAAVMMVALLTGGAMGLMLGAALFQLASIIDGVDGEIARATWRTSPAGAALDSAVDAVTNVGFLLGVVINLWMRGEEASVAFGLVGLIALSAGTAFLGVSARARKEPLHFDTGKRLIAGRETPLLRWARYVTMRDFYCLFFAVTIALGMHGAALAIFAVAACLWLSAISFLLLRAPVIGDS